MRPCRVRRAGGRLGAAPPHLDPPGPAGGGAKHGGSGRHCGASCIAGGALPPAAIRTTLTAGAQTVTTRTASIYLFAFFTAGFLFGSFVGWRVHKRLLRWLTRTTRDF